MKDIRKGYKVFNPDWTCIGFQYEVGKTYEHDGEIGLCKEGFHFCINPIDCFNYYCFDNNNKVAEVEAIGLVKTGDDKSVTNKIRIVRELDWAEVLKLVNTGRNNTGLGNSGDRNLGDYNSGSKNAGYSNSGSSNEGDSNSGDRNLGDYNSGSKNAGYSNSGSSNEGDSNSGDRNSGHRNCGSCNIGNSNSGYWNSGDYNSGNYNYGYWNSGHCNLGSYNSGEWNFGDGHSGVFCTGVAKIKIFDEESDMTFSEWRKTEAAYILDCKFKKTEWIYSDNMTNEEKEQNPTYKTTGGYLKTLSFKEACANMWKKLTDEEKDVIKNIPNFNKNKFKQITGIEI